MSSKEINSEQIILENKELKARLAEAEEALQAFRKGEADAKVVSGKEAGKKLSISSAETSIYNSMSEGLATHELIFDASGRAIDYIIVDVNPAFEIITGLKRENIIGKRATEAYSVLDAPYIDIYTDVATNLIPNKFETFFPPMKKYFQISVFASEPGKFSTVFQDITEKKESDFKLNHTLDRFYIMLSSMNTGVLLMTEDGKVEFVNQAFCKFFNLNAVPEDLLGISIDELLKKVKHAFKNPGVSEKKIREILKTGIPVRAEEIELKSGQTGLRNFIPLSVNGVSSGSLWVHVDITDQKLAEKALRESEERYRQLFNSIIEGFCIIEMIFDEKNKPIDYRFLEINNVFEKQTGLHDAKGRLMRDLAPNHESYWFEIYGKIALTGEIMRFENEAKALNRWFEVIAFRTDEPEKHKVAICFNDITERKIAGEALRQSEERFRLALKNAPVGVAVQNQDLIYTWAYNHRTITKEDIVGKTDAVLFAPEDLEWINPIKQDILKNGKETDVEKWLTSNGQKLFLGIHYEPIFNNSGEITGIGAATVNLTERKKIEEALQNSEEKFSKAFRNSPNAITITRLEDGKIIEGNDSVFDLLGYYRDEVMGKTTGELGIWSNPDDRVKLTQALASKGFIQNEDFVLTKKNGTFVPVSLSASLITIDNQPCFLCSFIDLTERKKAEEMLAFQAQLLSEVHDAVFSSDSNFIITYWNQEAEKMFGWTKEEALGKNSGELLKPKVGSSTRDNERSKLRHEGHWKGEVQYIRKDGSYFFTEVNSSVLRDSDGKDTGNVVIARDITERKKVEDALRRSEKRYRMLHENLRDSFVQVSMDGQIQDFNDLYSNMLGYTPDEIRRLTYQELTPERWHHFENGIIREQIIPRGYSDIYEKEYRRKDGKIIPVELRTILSYDDEGNPTSMWAIVRDISEKRRAEDALRASEARFRNLVKNAPTAIYEIDFGTRKFLSVNDAMCELSGYSKEELMLMDSLDLLEEESKKLFLSRIKDSQRGKKTEENVEYKVKAKDGHIIDAVLNMKFNCNEKGIPASALVVGHDITARKQTAEELRKAADAVRESQERFKTLAENIPDMIVRFDKDLRIIYGNEAVQKRTGLPINYLTGKTAKEYGSERNISNIWEKTAKEVFKSGNLKRIEVTNNWLGIRKTFDTMVIPEKDQAGKVNSVISISRDITEMKQAENILRESEQKLKYHLENSPLAIVEWDKEFNIIQWSTEAEKIFGLKKDDVMGVAINKLNIIYKDDIPVVEKTMSRLLSGDELKVISQNRNITSSGEIIECIWYNSVLLDEKGEMNSVMSLVEDITLLRKTEKELVESRESYKELVTNARSIIIKMDMDGRPLYVNEYASEFFGFTTEEMVAKPVLETIMPKMETTGRDLVRLAAEIINDPDKYSVNINENIKKNGEKVWIEWYNRALFDNDGKRTGLLAIGVDISKRRKAQEALRESQEKLWTVLNATRESVYMYDRNGRITMTNSIGLKRLHKQAADVIDHHFTDFMPPESAGLIRAKMDEVYKSGKSVQFEDERNGHIYHHNYFPVIKDDSVSSIVSYSADITEQKHAELKLMESEDRFRTIAESLPVLISITRRGDQKLLFVNEPFEEAFGYKKGELTGQQLHDYFWSDEERRIIGDVIKRKGEVYNTEVKVKKADGSTFWIMTSIKKIVFMNQQAFLTASIDITKTKETEQELIRLNRTLNAQSRSSQAMMHTRNEQEYLSVICKIIIEHCGHTMVWVGYAQNDEAKSVLPVASFGFDKGYIDQMNISWDDNDRGRGPTGTAIRTGKYSLCKNMMTDPCFGPWRDAAKERGYSSSLVLPLKSGGKTFGAISIYSKEPDPFSESEIGLLSELADDLAYGVAFIRLTESERAAARAIRESEAKLKELIKTKDKFFNIVAHDLKNPFTSLLGSSELLYDNISHMTIENVKKLALILNDSAKGGYAILQNLLDWSRSQTGMIKFSAENVNLKAIIDDNIDNVQLQVMNKGISVKSNLNEDLIITADRNMINTVLRNLLSNAVKYTPRDGHIEINAIKNRFETIINVKDSGVGISSEKVRTLFKIENSISQPGTEKEQGTGLGLRLCKEFTEMMGGRIWVESSEGSGSDFKFSIPLKSPIPQ